MDTELAIETVGLTKSYGKLEVLKGLDLTIPRGSIYALLGPNGAGKTTVVRVLATLTAPDGGQARVAGFDVVRERRQVQRRISLTGQFTAVDAAQTGLENLRMMGRFYGLSRKDAKDRAIELLDTYGLAEAGKRRTGTYSGGMRRRLDLAASLVIRPNVIFLDEPTTGLDLRSRQQMWGVITELSASGMTVFLTTQYLEEADQLADRIGMMDGGRLVAEGTSADLKQQVSGQRLELEMADGLAFQHVESALGEQVLSSDVASLTISVPTDGSATHVRDLLDQFDPMRALVKRFAIHDTSLDDVFLALTGRPVEEPATKETSNV